VLPRDQKEIASRHRHTAAGLLAQHLDPTTTWSTRLPRWAARGWRWRAWDLDACPCRPAFMVRTKWERGDQCAHCVHRSNLVEGIQLVPFLESACACLWLVDLLYFLSGCCCCCFPPSLSSHLLLPLRQLFGLRGFCNTCIHTK